MIEFVVLLQSIFNHFKFNILIYYTFIPIGNSFKIGMKNNLLLNRYLSGFY